MVAFTILDPHLFVYLVMVKEELWINFEPFEVHSLVASFLFAIEPITNRFAFYRPKLIFAIPVNQP